MPNKALVSQSPLVQDALGHLRDSKTTITEFRKYADVISKELTSYAIHTKDLTLHQITTPIQNTQVPLLTRTYIGLPILRSGLAMLPSFLDTTPASRVGFAGLARDEITAEAHEYYWKMPQIEKNDVIVILDPMIATGGSVLSVLRKLRKDLDNEIRVISIISSQPGITAIENEFPEVTIATSAIDPTLNAQKYIVPGLGDFGDRYFGTEQLLVPQI